MIVNIDNPAVKTIFLSFAPNKVKMALWIISLFYLLPMFLTRFFMIMLMRSEGRKELTGMEVQFYLIPILNIIALLMIFCIFLYDFVKNHSPWLLNWLYGRSKEVVDEQKQTQESQEPF